MQNALARDLGSWEELIDEKTEGRKSRDTIPLNKFYGEKRNVQNFMGVLLFCHFKMK
jgi:hypothetical protein